MEERGPPPRSLLSLAPPADKTLSGRLIRFRFSQGGGGGGGDAGGGGGGTEKVLGERLERLVVKPALFSHLSFDLPPPTQTSKHGPHAHVWRAEREANGDDDD